MRFYTGADVIKHVRCQLLSRYVPHVVHLRLPLQFDCLRPQNFYQLSDDLKCSFLCFR